MPRYLINTETDAMWDEVCDSSRAHVNGKGEPIARALPAMAKRICTLLNGEEVDRAARSKNRSRLGAGEVEGFFAMVILGLLFALLIVGVKGCSAAVGPKYSDGQRTGVVTKISRKGLVWKSWEAELNLGGASADVHGNMVPNVWRFSVQSDDIAHQLEDAARDARRASVHYRQYIIAPLKIDTSYVVDTVEVGSAEAR